MHQVKTCKVEGTFNVYYIHMHNSIFYLQAKPGARSREQGGHQPEAEQSEGGRKDSLKDKGKSMLALTTKSSHI